VGLDDAGPQGDLTAECACTLEERGPDQLTTQVSEQACWRYAGDRENTPGSYEASHLGDERSSAHLPRYAVLGDYYIEAFVDLEVTKVRINDFDAPPLSDAGVEKRDASASRLAGFPSTST
jgi:hypothetical protein